MSSMCARRASTSNQIKRSMPCFVESWTHTHIHTHNSLAHCNTAKSINRTQRLKTMHASMMTVKNRLLNNWNCLSPFLALAQPTTTFNRHNSSSCYTHIQWDISNLWSVTNSSKSIRKWCNSLLSHWSVLCISQQFNNFWNIQLRFACKFATFLEEIKSRLIKNNFWRKLHSSEKLVHLLDSIIYFQQFAIQLWIEQCVLNKNDANEFELGRDDESSNGNVKNNRQWNWIGNTMVTSTEEQKTAEKPSTHQLFSHFASHSLCFYLSLPLSSHNPKWKNGAKKKNSNITSNSNRSKRFMMQGRDQHTHTHTPKLKRYCVEANSNIMMIPQNGNRKQQTFLFLIFE